MEQNTSPLYMDLQDFSNTILICVERLFIYCYCYYNCCIVVDHCFVSLFVVFFLSWILNGRLFCMYFTVETVGRVVTTAGTD